jgi:hypothetical protein
MFINTGRTNIVLQHTKIIPLTITRNKHRYRTNIDGFEQETRCTGDKDSLTGIYPVTLKPREGCTVTAAFHRNIGDKGSHAARMLITDNARNPNVLFVADLESDDDSCAAYLPTRATLVRASRTDSGSYLAPDSALVSGQRYMFRFRLDMRSPPNAATVENDMIANAPKSIRVENDSRFSEDDPRFRPVWVETSDHVSYYNIQFIYEGDESDVVSDVANVLIAAWEKLPCFRTASPGNGTFGVTKTNVTVLLGQKKACYAWRAKELSTQWPYVQLYAPEDMNALPHTIEYEKTLNANVSVEDRCKAVESVTFSFTGDVRWVRLFADDHQDHKDEVTLSDPLAPNSEPSGRFKKLEKVVQKGETVTEAPGATDIQLQYTSNFSKRQKMGFYSNSLYLLHVGPQEVDEDHNRLFGDRWFGISSLIVRDNRQLTNPDSTINTFTFMTYLNTLEHDCRGRPNAFRSYGDLLDCPKLQLRPVILDLRVGAEYALDTSALNQVNSGALHVPTAFGSMSSVTFSPMGGIETGWNLLSEAHLPAPPRFFRWVAGSDASFRHKPPFPTLLGSKPYTLSGIFRARRLTTPEEFIPKETMTPHTTDGVTYIRSLDRKRLRLYGRAELGIPLSRIVSTAIVYQYGDLPPAFSFFGHTISIAVKISGPADSER